MAEDLLGIIRALSKKGWFSLETYNNALKSFGWFSHEMLDKPQPVPLSSSIVKLKGKACSQWVHIRNWPLIVKRFILDKDDNVLALGLKLHEVTERITATEYLEYEIQLLDECVLDYLDMRKQVRSEIPNLFKRPKPKHHFIRLAHSSQTKTFSSNDFTAPEVEIANVIGWSKLCTFRNFLEIN